ncbi:Ubiquitin-conjugating enzyme E2-16 kDa [Lasiodiplodia hormozganensis]|uniref:E2 ubiquitin-conjugating enzyme n=3 Tax=Lasiodiplodia TaxID=66739 RepID=A0A5N5DFH6_9PEZI|nr:Ubiquitin-conjugating enzyme E2-16 kDa [Lasiodiplodia theobromae]KAK0663765.1 Ubiquitin-conjugating enzyme E2-16 kDa [Lasiodiplodia hormozganensis]
MASGAQKRITKELTEVTNDPPPSMKVQLVDESDVHVWEVLIEGPEQSVYAGGQFRLVITLPKDYPFKPPMLNFHTKIYHPNVSNDDKGLMCLGMLRPDQWKPPNKLTAVLNMVHNLLIEPDVSDPVEPAIADVYKRDKKEFEKTAKDWVKRYASGKN